MLARLVPAYPLRLAGLATQGGAARVWWIWRFKLPQMLKARCYTCLRHRTLWGKFGDDDVPVDLTRVFLLKRALNSTPGRRRIVITALREQQQRVTGEAFVLNPPD
jgi:hypothetical protein